MKSDLLFVSATMNEQELLNVPVSTASSPAPASPENVPHLAMPVYYINQPVKPAGASTPATDVPTPVSLNLAIQVLRLLYYKYLAISKQKNLFLSLLV